MNYKTIELQLLQLEEAFSKSRSNIYSDTKKESHFAELYELFWAIKDSDYKKFDLPKIQDHKNLLDYIFKGLEYLDNSTLNVIPYEIVSCLEYALEDWIENTHFIIVTSLSNKNLDFYLESNDNEEFFNLINTYIYNLYSLKLTHRLIKISLPKILSRDYLSCVVLYHELGHFVDHELNISNKLLLKKYKTIQPQNAEQSKYLNHKKEFFADLFAAQYINDSSNLFLNHIAYKAPDYHTHPATDSRISIVEQFLKNQNCPEVNDIREVLNSLSLPELKIRHLVAKQKSSQLKDLIPQEFKNRAELHYIFKLGWDFWNDSESNFLKSFSPRQKYHIINNLIEKSISNFSIVERWNSN
ncbi:hypothetical protein V5739_07180 [Salinimicrobium sp. TIG7-5_MAKvit]|uniref:hypothetical protein n=1 Tax=Salinimicrobium sp. TIG7-5_MAKvit TaxID=3121289 RepID=UPI003C6E724E